MYKKTMIMALCYILSSITLYSMEQQVQNQLTQKIYRDYNNNCINQEELDLALCFAIIHNKPELITFYIQQGAKLDEGTIQIACGHSLGGPNKKINNSSLPKI